MAEESFKDLVKFKADPVLRRAIRLRAAYEDVDLTDVIVGILTKALAEEIAEVNVAGWCRTRNRRKIPEGHQQEVGR